MKRIVSLMLCCLLILILVPSLLAQEVVTDDEVNEVAKDLYCPVCESTPLDVCPTQACADWREVIRTQLSEGRSQEEINEYFARQYGDGVLAEPPRRGISLVLWIFPIVGVVVGGFFFSRYLGRLKVTDVDGEALVAAPMTVSAPIKETAVATPKTLDYYIDQIEQELANNE